MAQHRSRKRNVFESNSSINNKFISFSMNVCYCVDKGDARGLQHGCGGRAGDDGHGEWM